MTCRGVTYFDGVGLEPEGAAPEATAQAPSPEALLEASAASVTRAAAGVPQNVAAGTAAPDEANPVVEHEAPGRFNPDPACVRRLFVPVADGWLISISAETGTICPGFGGEDGTVNLWANMPNVTPGSAYSTSPPSRRAA